MKYLITNADDLGWGIDITKGIIDAHLNGVLTSASVLISEVDTESLFLIKQTPTLGLGLHLNIATGSPVSERWQQTYGNFNHPKRTSNASPYSQEEWNGYYGKFDTDLIFTEFESQLFLFKNLLGHLPDHIDTHYNTSSVNSVFEAYSLLSKKYNLPVRQPVGYKKSTGNMGNSGASSELIHIPEYLSKLNLMKIKTTDYFSLEYINLHEKYIGAVLSEIHKIDDGQTIEISFHPGYKEGWRRKQVEILTDPELKKALIKDKVELVSFYEIINIK